MTIERFHDLSSITPDNPEGDPEIPDNNGPTDKELSGSRSGHALDEPLAREPRPDQSQITDAAQHSHTTEAIQAPKEQAAAETAPAATATASPAWSGNNMKGIQDSDLTITLLWARVADNDRPAPEEMDNEGQEFRAMVQRWKELSVIDGILYRKSKYGQQAVIPPSLRMEIFRQMHGMPHVGGHLGRDRTYHRVRDRVWWPGYKTDLTRWVRSCRSCQLAKPGPGRGRLPLVQERAGSPFERVALDLVGPLPPSRTGKRYMLVIQDCFTKWLEVVPIPSKTSLIVTEAFTTNWITRYESPRILHQDNRSEFTSELFKEVCEAPIYIV